MVSMMVVDDDLMFADALCVAVEHIFQIAGVAASLEEAAAIAAREGPDVALVALDHPRRKSVHGPRGDRRRCGRPSDRRPPP
jgi:DNA-binding NarL/FixJ family response regulator